MVKLAQDLRTEATNVSRSQRPITISWGLVKRLFVNLTMCCGSGVHSTWNDAQRHLIVTSMHQLHDETTRARWDSPAGPLLFHAEHPAISALTCVSTYRPCHPDRRPAAHPSSPRGCRR